MEDKLGSVEALLDNFYKGMKRNPKKTLLVVGCLVAGIIISGFLYASGVNFSSSLFMNTDTDPKGISPIAEKDESATTTTKNSQYSPQNMQNSPGGVQVQGGSVILTRQTQEPYITYTLETPSKLLENGLYFAKIEVRVAYAKQGKLKIDSARILCSEVSQRWSQVQGEDAIVYTGVIWQLNCESKQPIVENTDYFSYKNNN